VQKDSSLTVLSQEQNESSLIFLYLTLLFSETFLIQFQQLTNRNSQEKILCRAIQIQQTESGLVMADKISKVLVAEDNAVVR
jgi:hypothetical protein